MPCDTPTKAAIALLAVASGPPNSLTDITDIAIPCAIPCEGASEVNRQQTPRSTATGGLDGLSAGPLTLSESKHGNKPRERREGEVEGVGSGSGERGGSGEGTLGETRPRLSRGAWGGSLSSGTYGRLPDGRIPGQRSKKRE